MNLDVTGIVNAKILNLEESGAVKKQIEDSVEKTVMCAIVSALEGYSFKRDIETQVEKCIGGIAGECGLSAYNGFISEKVKQITEGVMREDIAQKIQKQFNDMLIARHDGIKLSHIFKAYRDWLLDVTDESEKWERREFTSELDVNEDGSFTHYTIKLSDAEINGREDVDIEISLCVYGNKSEADISRLSFNGKRIDTTLRIGALTAVEALLLNLYYNKTPIILDVEDVDDDSHYDIDG